MPCRPGKMSDRRRFHRVIKGRRSILPVLLIFSSVLFSSCAGISVNALYGTLRWYVERQIAVYFDLDRAQKKKVSQKLDSHFAWHRKEGVDDIILIFQMMRRDIPNRLTVEGLAAYEPVFRRHQERLALRLFGDMVDFLMDLNENQIKHLEKELAASEQKYRDNLKLSRDERIKKNSRFTIQALEFFLGDLTGEQKSEFYRLSAESLDITAENFEVIRERNREFLEILATKRSSSETLSGELEKWLKSYESRLPAGYRRTMELVKNETLRNIIYFESTLVTETQRNHALRRIDLVLSMLHELKKS